MDENIENTESMEDFKKYMLDMMNALNEKIDALNDVVVNQIMKPAIEQYQNERYEDFKGKYGERLGKYDSILKKSFGDDYDNTREAWQQIQDSSEGSEDYDIDGAVSDMEKQTLEFVNNLRAEMGLDPEAAVNISSDGNGDVKVEADSDGDGKPDTEVVEESQTKAAENSEGSGEAETPDGEEEEEVDPELQKQLDEYLNN